jgi:hypothetical protein
MTANHWLHVCTQQLEGRIIVLHHDLAGITVGLNYKESAASV